MSFVNAIVGQFMTPEGPIVNPQYQAPKWLTEERYAEMHTSTWTPKIEQHFLDGVLISQTIQYTPKGDKEPYSKKQWIGLTEQEKLELKNTNMPTMALIDTVCALLKAQNHD